MTTELIILPEFKFSSFEPAVVEFNFTELSSAADAHLEKYSKVKVTLETLADDKKLAQELGKQAKVIARARIDMKKELTEHINEPEHQMKEIEGKFLAAQSAISEQVKVFEQEKLKEIYEIIATEFDAQVEKAGLRAEFANFQDVIQSLTKLTAITKTDALTAKTKSEISMAVSLAASTQNNVDMRVLKLENECYRLGLAAPLTKDHVSHILLLDEEAYQAELEKIINAEIQREQQAVAAHKARIEAEAKAKAEAEANAQAQAQIAAERAVMEAKEAQRQAEQTRFFAGQQAELDQQLLNSSNSVVEQPAHQLIDVNEEPIPAPAPAQQTEEATSGKTIVTCTFELDVPAHAPSAAIEAKFRKMLEAAGFTTLANIHIQRPQSPAA